MPHPIAQFRAAQNPPMTQDAFGAIFGVDGLTVSRWERLKSVPRKKYWPKLTKVTGRSISEIIEPPREASEAAE
jgi:hypothetical protein